MPEITATIIAVALAALAIPVLLASWYLGGMAIIARAGVSSLRRSPATRFDIVVPAHDEELNICATLESLRALEYPRGHYRIIVVADNCRDDTAGRAHVGGAHVLVRDDADHQGKGYALAHAFEWSQADGYADAVVVVDADTLVSPALLLAFDAAIARGHEALQGRYAVRNQDRSWRTRLLALAFVLIHDVRSFARERLGLSVGLRGNGMCFSLSLLQRVPYRAFSLVEDIEFGLQLGLAGVRAAYVAGAQVWGEMPDRASTAEPQRRRWEAGRAQLRRKYTRALVRAAVRRRSTIPLDLALDLAVPPLSRLASAAGVGWLSSLALLKFGGVSPPFWLWSVAIAGLATYVMRGCIMTGSGIRAAINLLWTPVYMGWKLGVWAVHSRATPSEWVRTARAGESGGRR